MWAVQLLPGATQTELCSSCYGGCRLVSGGGGGGGTAWARRRWEPFGGGTASVELGIHGPVVGDTGVVLCVPGLICGSNAHREHEDAALQSVSLVA